MTMSITSLSQNPQPDQPHEKQDKTAKMHPLKLNKKSTHARKSRLLSARRRAAVNSPEEEDGEDEEAQNGNQLSSDSNSDDDSTTSSLDNSEDDDDDGDEDEDDEDEDEDNVDEQDDDDDDDDDDEKEAQVTDHKKKANGSNYDDEGQAFQVDHDDLESGVSRPPTSTPRLNGHSNESDSEDIEAQTISPASAHHHQPTPVQTEVETSSTFVPNKIAKTKSGQNPTDEPSSSSPTGQTTALSTPASSADSSTRRLKQPPQQQLQPTAVPTQSHNTTIIFNQASWVTGLSAALAATTTPNNNNHSGSTEDQPAQTPRYIPYIEFENYSTYGNLIFDLNTGLSRTTRGECKPDGLEKAPPEALEEQFVRISPSRDLPSNSTLSPNLTNGRKDYHSTAPTQRANDIDGTSKDGQDDDRTYRSGKKFGSLGEKNKKKKKKKKKETAIRVSLDGHAEGDNEQSEQRLKIKIIPPQQSSSTKKPIETSSTSTSSHFNLPHNRPPSSLAGGIINNRPSSSFSFAAQSEDNRSASASEAHSLEPWAVPRSGRFWGHDDRQSYHHRRGGREFGSVRGGASSSSLRKRGGFRADWPATSPSSRKSHGSSTHRPGTPAGQSDTGRSVGSGAGWITVPSKQKAFANGFHHQLSHLNSQRHHPEQGDNGEWRHDGWEEIEREADRKLHSSNRGRVGFHPSRGSTAGWRGGAPPFHQSRRPTTNLNTTSETQSASGKTDNCTTKSSASASTSTPRAQEKEAIKVSLNPTPIHMSSQANSRDEPRKPLVNGHHVEVAAQKTPSPLTVETVTRSNQSPSLSSSATPSSQPQPVLVQLPRTIKIGTIPVYPPVTLQSPVAEKREMMIKSQAPSSPTVDHGSSSVASLGHSPRTPDLSDTPQVSRSASTLEEKSDPVLTPVSATEPPTGGAITLGSAGGAEVLREAMSTPKLSMPAAYPPPPPPPPPQDLMLPSSRADHPARSANSQHGGQHSRSSSFNSHVLPPGSFGHHHHHHHHPDFLEQQPGHLRQPPPPPHNFVPNHPSHLSSSTSYHNPIPLPPPPPPHSTMHQSSHFYHHQPALPPIPPLQYFESHNHNAGYPPSYGGPLQSNHVFGGGGYPPPSLPPPPPPPQQQQQLGPSRGHPAIFHPLPPQQPAFESTPPPPPHTLPPPPAAPPTPASPGMTLPGHFAPPKSTKVRISHPGAGSGANHGPDDSFYFASSSSSHHPHHTKANKHLSSSSSSSAAAGNAMGSTDTLQIQTTETGISYYEYNGVTYFGDSLPPHLAPASMPEKALHPRATDEGLTGSLQHQHQAPPLPSHHHQQQHPQLGGMHPDPGAAGDFRRLDEFPLFPPPHLPLHLHQMHHPHPHPHHHPSAHHHPHLFPFTGLRNSLPDDFGQRPPLPIPAHPNPIPPNSGATNALPLPVSDAPPASAIPPPSSGGQVVLSQVIRPLGIPFG